MRIENSTNHNKLIIKASAGTGKTYTLSLKYIVALYNDIDYKNILVMTFTKKATAEIKEKILERLEELIFSEDNSILIENLKEQNNKNFEMNENNKNKFLNIYRDMQKNKDKIKIYTIDSFMNIIFKNIVSKFKNFSSFSMIGEEKNSKKNNLKEDSYYYKKILEKIFQDKKLFEEFKNFLSDNTEKDISNYLSVIKELIENRWKYLIAKEENNNFFDKKKLEVGISSCEILDEIFNFIEKDCGKDLEKAVKKAFKVLIEKNEKEKNEEKRKKIIENIGVDFFKLDKDGNSKNNPISYSQFRGEKNIENKEYINNLFEKFKGSLAREIYNNKILTYEKKLLDFSDKIFQLYDSLKFKERKFSFTDITLYTYMTIFNKENKLIDIKENKNCGLNNLFFEMLDMKIDAIFIDEFQDTSILQWKILNEIIKKTKQVICVGDEKQSIYGWRDGEKKLFENLENIITGNIASLNKSYRSDKNIIDYVNLLFNNIPDWKYDDCECHSDKEGYVKYIYSKKNNKEKTEEYNTRTYEILLEEIKKLNLDSYENIAIIARNNDTLKNIVNILELENIKCTLHKTEETNEEAVIFEFFEFLKYLFLDDDLALFNFLASDLSPFGTEEIEFLLKNKVKFLNFLKNNMDKNIFEKNNFLEKIKRFKSQKNCRIFSASEFIFKIFTEFNFIDIFNSTDNLKNILEIFLLSKKYSNIIEFFEDYQKGNINFSEKLSNEKSKGIELMTIHKSKGLQFETVFYIELDNKKYNKKELKFLFNMDKNYENTVFSIFYDTKYKEVLEICFPEILYEYNKKIEEEEINNKYVALTRAKNNLFFISQKNNMTEDLYERGEFSKKNKYLILEDKKEENAEILEEVNENLSKINIISENKIEKFEINKSKFYLETEEKRKLGILIHYFLENIKYANKQEIEFSKKLCYKNYVSYFGEEKLNNIFSDRNIKEIFEKDKEIFSDKWNNIYSEYELYDKDSKIKYRIDRLMIKNEDELGSGEVFIIDYKTGQKNEEQLENYKSLLLKNFPELKNYKIRTKFIEFNIVY